MWHTYLEFQLLGGGVEAEGSEFRVILGYTYGEVSLGYMELSQRQIKRERGGQGEGGGRKAGRQEGRQIMLPEL